MKIYRSRKLTKQDIEYYIVSRILNKRSMIEIRSGILKEQGRLKLSVSQGALIDYLANFLFNHFNDGNITKLLDPDVQIETFDCLATSMRSMREGNLLWCFSGPDRTLKAKRWLLLAVPNDRLNALRAFYVRDARNISNNEKRDLLKSLLTEDVFDKYRERRSRDARFYQKNQIVLKRR